MGQKFMNWFKRILRSVFTKLLVVIVLTGICINLVVVGFFWLHRSAAGRPLHKNILQYLNYIVDDLGSPPDLVRAKQIGRQASLQIYYDGMHTNWTTAENFSDIQKAHWRDWSRDPIIRLGSYHGHHFVELIHESGRFVFGLDKSFELDPERKRLVIILLSLLTLILAGAFLSIRWILKPVRWLNEGVREVSQGNLKYRVPLKRSDELRDLAAAFNDMTERIRDMLHSKEQLLLDVSHELRSPLTRVKVALEFMPDGQAKESITGDVVEMEKMINEILETARMHHLHGKLKVERVLLTDILKEVLPEFENQSPGVQADDIPTGSAIQVDPEQIKIVFKNILTNAIKFSSPDSQPVSIRLKDRPPNIVLQIADHGIGIPQDELPFIFEPFYRVDKSRTKDTGGYGLGLSLCKTIMEAHGGRIQIDSTPNVGTTVTLFFPN
ncbi:Two-component system sensor histidine kinase [Olavius sp. associated proteobacterium Delta 1]|nr:Two-component system sensor histidine kinase [Olavius sp. associated proteobacterium Delta 1]